MSVKRYSVSPFLDKLSIKKKTKNIRISTLGSDDNIIINQSTGEIKGTHISTYRQVDETKFVKLFTQNIALTFDLTSAGIKAFNVLMYALQNQAIDKDIVALDRFVLQDFLKNNSLKLSLTTFSRGLSELVNSQIIARHNRQGFFFINPSFCFNGDRLAFTTVIERKNRAELDKLEHDFELEKEEEVVV
jgi:hypothetical protein